MLADFCCTDWIRTSDLQGEYLTPSHDEYCAVVLYRHSYSGDDASNVSSAQDEVHDEQEESKQVQFSESRISEFKVCV